MTDVCIKRKIRNRIEALKELCDGYDIWVRSGTYLRETLGNAFNDVRKETDYPKEGKGEDKKKYEQKRICAQFFDIRAFGGVLTSDSDSGDEEDDNTRAAKPQKGVKKEEKSQVKQVRGPVSIQYAKSVAPIVVEDDEITRVCPTVFDPKKPDKQTERGRKKRVPFGVYIAKGSVSARLAEGEKGTGFSVEDLLLLKESLATLFVGDESAARPAGAMVVQKLVFFTHTNKDGDEPVHKTLDRVKVVPKQDCDPMKVRDMSAYLITVDREGIPGGDSPRIKVEEVL